MCSKVQECFFCKKYSACMELLCIAQNYAINPRIVRSKQPITAACSIDYSMYRMDIGPLGNDSGNVECNIALHNLLKLHHCCTASSSAHHCCASFGWISSLVAGAWTERKKMYHGGSFLKLADDNMDIQNPEAQNRELSGF